jgi:hypothetical protein
MKTHFSPTVGFVCKDHPREKVKRKDMLAIGALFALGWHAVIGELSIFLLFVYDRCGAVGEWYMGFLHPRPIVRGVEWLLIAYLAIVLVFNGIWLSAMVCTDLKNLPPSLPYIDWPLRLLGKATL